MTTASSQNPNQTTQTIEANGIRFAYYEQGEGPLVLLLHGFPDSADSWGPFLSRIAEAGFRVVAPFLRGYAPSSSPADGNYSGLELGADVLALIDALGEEKAIVIGHDWGAMSSYVAAALDTEAGTQKIQKLVTLAIPHPRVIKPSPKALWKARHFLVFQFRGWSMRKLRKNNFAYINDIFRRWSPGWDVTEEDLAAVKACFAKPGTAEAALGYYWSFRDDQKGEPANRLQTLFRQKLPMPTMALAGEDDGALDPSAYTRSPKAYAGHYEYHILPKVGHFLNHEDPDACLALILPFLKTDFP